jgi:AP endonuclease-2
MKAAAGQKTLQGFFKLKNAPAVASAGTDGTQAQAQSTAASARQTPPPGGAESNGAASQYKTPTKLPTEQTSKATLTKGSGGLQATSMSTSPGKIFDPVENKESWSKLLGKRVVPKCEHNEPCISLLTKKPGVNCGEWLG